LLHTYVVDVTDNAVLCELHWSAVACTGNICMSHSWNINMRQ